MAEFIHPGVFVEEVEAGPRPIEGVGTSTAAFIGLGEAPIDAPVLLTDPAGYEHAPQLRSAVDAFFESGGKRLYVQTVSGPDEYERGLRALEAVDEITLIAAPGAAIAKDLVEHAERMRYRLALLDAPAEGIDSSFAAAYAADGLDGPASAYAAGVFARTDAIAPPAAGGDENVVRRLEDGSIGIAGNRTLSSDPEWKYVNVRRYFIYLEHSIDRGTQWTVFEPNGEELWATLRTAIADFLLGEHRAGRLAGRTPEDAFFVRCDRSTMTQDDLDEGRLTCLVGVAPLRPAEFVIIRIGRWTADHRCP